MKNQVITLASVLVLSFAGVSQAASVDDAVAVSNAIKHAKSVVDSAIAGTGSVSTPAPSTPAPSFPSTPAPGSFPTPGDGPWEAAEDLVTEADFLALPIYQAASNDLFEAASLADRAIINLSGPNIQQGVFFFAQSCAKMGIARSKVARANLAAAQPPQGFLAAFGPQLEEVVVELNNLHQRCL